MSHLQIAKNVLRFESEQMLKTMEKLDDTFDDAVQAILAAKGKIVVCGIGKSGAVAAQYIELYERLIKQRVR